MRPDRNRIFYIAFAGVFIAGVLFVSHGIARKNGRALNEAARESLERVYAKILAESGGSNAPSFPPEPIADAVRTEAAKPNGSFASFIEPQSISVAATTIARGTTNLICAVRVSKQQRFGIDGAG